MWDAPVSIRRPSVDPPGGLEETTDTRDGEGSPVGRWLPRRAFQPEDHLPEVEGRAVADGQLRRDGQVGSRTNRKSDVFVNQWKRGKLTEEKRQKYRQTVKQTDRQAGRQTSAVRVKEDDFDLWLPQVYQ